MKKVVFILFALMCVAFVANASSENETYVCTVQGWNNANGEEKQINIYLRQSNYMKPCYIGRTVDASGNVSSLSGFVKFVTSSTYSSNYRYCVKTGFVGSYMFNTNRLNEKYVDGDPDEINIETYVCTVYGWNSADGRESKINIYLFQSKYAGTYYVAREVDSRDGSVSIFSGRVKLVTNPEYKSSYGYFAKTGMLGSFFFNTNALSSEYIKP